MPPITNNETGGKKKIVVIAIIVIALILIVGIFASVMKKDSTSDTVSEDQLQETSEQVFDENTYNNQTVGDLEVEVINQQ